MEWKAFVDLGLTSELLPVVSDTSLPVSPRSSLKEIGKVPSTINRLGQIVGLPEWTGKQATDREVAKWSSTPELGVCLNTRRYRAVDIDIADKVEAERVATMVEMVLGPLPRRTRPNSGKMVLLFEMEGVFPKRRLATSHGLIEFLGNGNQCVLAGTHPSGVRYEWLGGLPKEIPTVTPAEFEPLWDVVVAAFGLKGQHHIDKASVALEKPRSADDIDDEVVDFLEREGHVTGYAPDGKVFVRCPWKGLHSSDNGPSETTWLPRGVGGGARGHFKCMHTSHGNKTDDQFLHEIGFFNDQFEIVAKSEQAAAGLPAVEDLPPFTRDRLGRIESTAMNVLAALRRPDMTGWRLGFDEFIGAQVIAPYGATEWRMFKDTDYFMLREALERRKFKSPSSELIKEAVRYAAEESSFDSAIQWGSSLVWDGVERVEKFFPTYLGCSDTPYARAVGVYLWTALAGRCLDPGCKVDMVPVLISAQGTGKTSLVEALAPTKEAFIEINLEHRDDQLSKQLRGKLVGEIAELRGLMTRESEAIKAWISRREEEVRGLYKEFHRKYPRRLVMIGTGNKEFLSDETGERRWLPIRVGRSNMAALTEDVNQLWAEGVHKWRAGGVQWREAQHLAVDEHADFKVADEWEGVVRQWLESDAMDGADGPKRGDQPLELIAVAVGALGFAARDFSQSEQRRLGKVMRTLGYDKRASGRGDARGKRWFRAEKRTFQIVEDFV